MQQKLKLCFRCEKPRVIWKRHEGKLVCKNCWGALKTGVATSTQMPTESITNKSSSKTSPSRRSPIKKVSDKRQKQNVLYKVLREQFLKDHPTCMVANKGICTYKSTQIHHMHSGKDREQYYLDTTTWLAVCFGDHEWIHDHPIESKELGFLK